MKIKVGFSRPKKWAPFAALIMAGYGIPYSHVYIRLYSDKYNRELIYQASKTMVNFMGNEVFNSHNEIVEEFEIHIADDSYVKLLQFSIDNAGKPYGMKQCIGMAFVRICEIFGKYVKNPFRDEGDTFVCSEMSAYILENFTNFSKLPKDLDDITPKDVYEYMKIIVAEQAAQLPKQQDPS